MKHKSRRFHRCLTQSTLFVGYILYKKVYIPGKVIETERTGGELVAKVLQAHGTLVTVARGLSVPPKGWSGPYSAL